MWAGDRKQVHCKPWPWAHEQKFWHHIFQLTTKTMAISSEIILYSEPTTRLHGAGLCSLTSQSFFFRALGEAP